MSLCPCTHTEELEEVPGFQLQISPTLAIASIWGVNQEKEAVSLWVSPSLYNSTFQRK